MKRVVIKEEKFKKLLKEGGYGNDDLENLYDVMNEHLSELCSAIGEHYAMVSRMNQQPNQYVVQIDEHLNDISAVMSEWRERLAYMRREIPR